MSGPNTEYDPVEVTPLQAEQVAAMRDEALAAIAAAAGPRRAQAGPARPRRRPVAAGPGQPRDRRAAAAGPQGGRPARRPGPRRGRTRRSPSAPAVLEAEAEERMLVEETVDVTLPTDRRPRGARHPITLMSELHRRPLRGDGLGGRRGPGARGRVAQLRRPQPRPRPPGPHHAGHVLDRARRGPPRAAHPHLAGAGPHHADAARRRSTSICPGRVFRTDEYDATHSPDVPPGRGARRRRGHHDGPPQGHPRPLRRSRCSATGSRRGSARRTSPSPSRRAEVDLVCFVCRGAARRGRARAAPARARAGSSGAAAAWSTRGCSPPAASTPSATAASRSAWASTGR